MWSNFDKSTNEVITIRIVAMPPGGPIAEEPVMGEKIFCYMSDDELADEDLSYK